MHQLLAAAYMATAIGYGICFVNVAFFQVIPSTSLNGFFSKL